MNSDITTWRKELTEACEDNGETLADLVITLTDDQLDVEFDSGYGLWEGAPFTAWSANFVYFPWGYDGAEGVACVPRNPNGEPTSHIGGGG
jgi:hypothetical protein